MIMSEDLSRRISTRRVIMSRKPLILIAEDDDKYREILESALQDHYRLLFAKDGLQTIEQVQSQSPDLIVMASHMPKLNGWQTIREIRAVRKKVPIIVLAGYPDPYDKSKAERLGVVDCLSKPFDVVYLHRLIRENTNST
jgi:CheY-like chemotaxis protein